MKWIEVIELRLNYNRADKRMLESWINTFIETEDSEKGYISIQGYHHTKVGTDYCLHIQHKTHKIDIEGSPMGMQIAASLKEYGIVHHTVWQAMKK